MGAQRAEKQIQESEQKFRGIYEESPIGIEIYNTDGELIEVNQSCLEIFGVSSSEQIKEFKLFDDPNITDNQKEKLRNNEKVRYEVAFDFGKVKGAELYETTKSGSIHLDVLITPLVDEKVNMVRGYLVQVVDITERKEIEKEIKESKENLRITLNSIGDAVISTDIHGTVVQMNPVAEKLCGCDLGAAQGQKIENILHIMNADTMTIIETPVTEVIKTGKAAGLANHTILVSKDGNEYQIADSAAPITDDDGTIIGVVLVFRDITEQYVKDKKLRESEYLLGESQKIAHLGSWALDLVINKLYWSDEVYRIFGLEPQEIGASYEDFLEAVHPEDRNAVHNAYTTSLDEGKDGYEIEHRVVHKKTGEIRFVKERCYHTRDDEGNIVKSIGMIQDITERKKAE